MKIEIIPTKEIDRLAENLEKRVKELDTVDGKIIVEIDDPEMLSRTPGVESYSVNGEEKKGLGGEPVSEQAYARLESREDAVKAFLATVMGYDLRVLNTSREWDYRNLKRYNPDIKHLKFPDPRKELEIDKALFDAEKAEKVEINLKEVEVEKIYREMLT